MAKSHAPEKLDVEFRGKMNETLIQISIGYKNIITDLGMYAHENEDLLLQPSFRFEHLESLYLNEIYCNDEEKATAFEAMLNKHSNNLNDLAVDFKFYGYGEESQRSVIVPVLPKLCSLSLSSADENAFSFLDASRPTITSLVLTYTFNGEPPFDYWPSENPSDYELPNIQHLSLCTSSAFEFVKYNAQNLVSLELDFYYVNNRLLKDLESETLFFPKLRELKLSNWNLTPILMKCKDTLELLVINSHFTQNIFDYDLELPRLADLVVEGNIMPFTIEFLNSNNKTLECLWISKMPDWESKLEGCTRLDSVTKIVGRGITAQEKEKMAVVCPNAEFIIKSNENKDRIQDLIRSRCKRKKFSFDMFDSKLYSMDNKS